MKGWTTTLLYGCELCPQDPVGQYGWSCSSGEGFMRHLADAHGIPLERKADIKGTNVTHLCGGRNGSTHVAQFYLDGRMLLTRTQSTVRAKQCSVCKVAEQVFLCDGPRAGGKTCDAGLCKRCATEVGPDKHHCPKCRKQTPSPEQLGLL